MRSVRAAASVCLAAAACLAGPGDPVEAVSLRASTDGGFGSSGGSVSIASDGNATVEMRPSRTRPGRTAVVAFALPDGEMDVLRALVAETRFFAEWGPAQSATDLPTWDVTVVLGDREKHRPQIYAQPEFAPLERWLWRFVAQAEAIDDVRRGGAVGVASRLLAPSGRERFVRSDLVAAAVAAALPADLVAAKGPYDAAEAARLLVEILPAPDWERAVPEILAKLGGDRRDEALRAWAAAVGEPGHAAQRAAFAPVAVAEVRSSWRDWGSLGYRRTEALGALLASALREKSPDAVALAGEMMRSLSTSDRPFVAPGLHLLGADAVAVALRLLGDAKAEARAAAAALAERLARVVKVPPRDNLLPLETRAALEKRLTGELLPAVAARAADRDEALFVREECTRALDAWTGRDRYAERREKQRAEAQRWDAEQQSKRKEAEEAAREAQAEPPPVPHGDLSISGRLVAEADAGLPGFTVVAMRADGPAVNPWRFHGSGTTADDGTFRVDGLTDGAFRLVALRGTRWGWREFANNSSQKDGVGAGSDGVVLRFKGTLIRGRLFDASGRAVARRQVAVRMRDPPGVLEAGLDIVGWAETEADGRFVVLQLLPGVYDVEVPGHTYLGGADGLVPSAEERTISILEGGAITGRVLDETGAPLAGAWVGAVPAGASGARSVATTGPDGAFRLAELDPAKRWSVAASYQPLTGADRSAQPVEKSAGAADVVFRIDTTPRLALQVDFSRRRAGGGSRCIRLVPDGVAGGAEREFDGDRVLWRCAPVGTWRVFALVRDLDDDGGSVERWIEIGTVTTGEAERVLVVPR